MSEDFNTRATLHLKNGYFNWMTLGWTHSSNPHFVFMVVGTVWQHKITNIYILKDSFSLLPLHWCRLSSIREKCLQTHKRVRPFLRHRTNCSLTIKLTGLLLSWTLRMCDIKPYRCSNRKHAYYFSVSCDLRSQRSCMLQDPSLPADGKRSLWFGARQAWQHRVPGDNLCHVNATEGS